MEANNREIEKEDARIRLRDYGWSFEDLAEFGIQNIVGVSGTQLNTKLMNTLFPRKTLGEMIELFELLKGPFNIRWTKSEYKRIASEKEKAEYLEEIRYEMIVFMMEKFFALGPEDARKSAFTSVRRSRVTFPELKALLKK